MNWDYLMVMWCILEWNLNIFWDYMIFIKKNIMSNYNLNKTLDNFVSPKQVRGVSNDGMEREECDLQTGECYVIRSKDGIVERINKKVITEDGRQLLQD